ncbi:MAG: hypothetical protein Unbinned657contig1001_6 [Prokaryotic dsDNA virus sp.]|nr:MAG: hypothetical protein Unbinned657contig1001_6 [Prokaryotic dsDNA virus sp.]|tara:strand:+ start:906 stop:1340 length:435 start_codon:yes stop_codon:yes gene_type:complete
MMHDNLEQNIFDLGNLNDVELVDNYIKIKDQLEEIKKKKFALEQKALRIMEERGSTIIQGDAKELVLDKKPIYDKTRLKPIKELVNLEDLIRRKALIPEQTIVQEEQWNMTNLKPFAKYGEDIQKYIDKSVIGETKRFVTKDRR